MAGPLAQAVATSARLSAVTRSLLMDARSASPDLETALLDAVALFRALRVRYALVGGLAAMVYGRARYTEDVDFVATPDHERVLAEHPEVMTAHRFDPSCTWKLYHASGVEIDLWKDEHADGIVSRATRRKIAGRFVRVADPHDLIAMKLRAGRPQDDYDISEIVKHQAIEDVALRSSVTAAQFKRYRAIVRRVRVD